MKKTSFFFVMALSAILALNSCENIEISAAPEIEPAETDFIIVATSGGVRTSIDGYQTSWAAGDGLTLWHAESGSSTYTKDGQFSADAAGTETTFSGTLSGELDPASSYDWYAIYPYKSGLNSPAGDPSSFTGAHSMGPLAKNGHPYLLQTGDNSTAHISGTEFAFAGRALDVKGDEAPAIELKPVFSIAKVVVTNKSSDPLHVFSVRFTSPDYRIEGQTAIDFSGEGFAYTPNPASTYDHVCLEVKPDAAIPTDGSAAFYFTLRPFTASAGKQLKVKVNGYEKTIDLSSDCTFSAGKVKTINFAYDEDADMSGDYYVGATSETGDLYLTEAKNFTRGQVQGGSIATYIAPTRKVRIDGDDLIVQPDMSSCTADTDATIADYVYTFTKVTSGDYAGLYAVTNKDGKYMSVVKTDDNDIQFTDDLKEGGANSYWAIGADSDGKSYIVAPYSTGRRCYGYLKGALTAGTKDYVRATIYPYYEFQTYPTLYKCSDYNVFEEQKYYTKVTSEPADWTGTYLIVHTTQKKCFDGSITNANQFDGAEGSNSVDVIIETDGRIKSTGATDSHAVIISKNDYVLSNDTGKNLWKDVDLTKYPQPYSIRTVKGTPWYFGLYGAGSTATLNHNTDERFVNFISLDGSNAIIKTINKTDSVTGYFRYNVAAGRFRYFDATASQAIQLYRLDD